jgi:uncharacterized protein (DUF2384 family)
MERLQLGTELPEDWASVWSNALQIYELDAARAWLVGINPLLGDRRPIDFLRAGMTAEVLRAIRAERADSFA